MMGKDGDDGMRMFTTCGDRRHRLVFYKRVDGYYTFHINLFLSLGIQQSSLLYSMILYLYSFLCVNIRFDLENVDRADIFSNKTRGGKILPLRR